MNKINIFLFVIMYFSQFILAVEKNHTMKFEFPKEGLRYQYECSDDTKPTYIIKENKTKTVKRHVYDSGQFLEKNITINSQVRQMYEGVKLLETYEVLDWQTISYSFVESKRDDRTTRGRLISGNLENIRKIEIGDKFLIRFEELTQKDGSYGEERNVWLIDYHIKSVKKKIFQEKDYQVFEIEETRTLEGTTYEGVAVRFYSPELKVFLEYQFKDNRGRSLSCRLSEYILKNK